MPTLSIIIPVLNEEKRLRSLIPFLIKNTNNSEIIIIDCKYSSDQSKKVCTDYPVQYIRSNNVGRAYQMNEGAASAKGDVLMFLHADVFPPKSFEKDIFAEVRNGFQAGFFAYEFDPTNRWLSINARFTKKDGLFAGGGDQCQFMTRKVFDEIGGYDESYVIMEDFAMIRKMKRKSLPLTIIQEPAIVSSRKYKKNSYLRVNLVNFIVFMAFLLGVSPFTLKKMYSFSLK